MFIQTRRPLAACLLNDYVLYFFIENLGGTLELGPMAPSLIRHCIQSLLVAPVVDSRVTLSRNSLRRSVHVSGPLGQNFVILLTA